ncbi:hypothetical protein [Cognatilysobacter lacus]|uniref:Uncharacterized protein n=1 Tax=Cognatilysobacter lacus TaxID=1643323 RepID=A0A5D8Z5H6_9GAMM|nr:hypothetical protein [Lysobacter lacus]TZF89900.1 hypothetical protein FW784_07415 [Lysobacter lacus]
MDRFPSTTTPSAVATLSPGQMVCIHYRAQPSDDRPGWRYVTAIDESMVKACKGECTTPHAAAAWVGPKPQLPCRVTHGAYSAGCPSGWIRADRLDEYSMGLPPDGETAAPTLKEAYETALPDTTIYSVTQAAGYACVVGARLDDLGRQSAIVAKFANGDTTPVWTTLIPHDSDVYANRATHCACESERCYVLVATDTQPAQSTSQTLISIARLSTAGAIVGTHEVTTIPGVPGNASAWLDAGSSHFVLKGQSLALAGLWRASPEDAPRPFTLQVSTF